MKSTFIGADCGEFLRSHHVPCNVIALSVAFGGISLVRFISHTHHASPKLRIKSSNKFFARGIGLFFSDLYWLLLCFLSIFSL